LIFNHSDRAKQVFGVPGPWRVNSTHHQGVKNLGKNLQLEAQADDGVIEAISLKDHPFCWGVEWHPERLLGDPVIPAFLKACQR
jgi:putative glutamine amidotransferase